MADVKELKEALAAVRILAVSGISIAKDGLSFDDIAKVIVLVEKNKELIEGFKGLDQIPAEVKDIDSAEVVALVSDVIALVNDIKKAAKGEPVVL